MAAIVFAALILAAFNAGWWWYYRSITAYLEDQLSQRLTGMAAAAALHITPDKVEGLLIDDLDVYAGQLLYLDSLAGIGALSEASIIDLDFNYLVSTRENIPLEGYLLARLNFDSLSAAITGRPAVSRLYDVDGTFLKSAYAPLYNNEGEVAAILVAEAGAGYFDLMANLRHNLFLLAGGSAAVVVVFLILYIVYNRRMAVAEEKLFQAGSQAALGRMVAVVSHEIKNPMMIIRAAGERIEKKYADPEAAFIVEEVSRLDSIVSGYLSFARGDLSLRPEPVDLVTLLPEVIAEFSPQFDEQGIRLDVKIEAGLPTITADRTGLRQVIINLLLNAFQAVAGDDRTLPEKLVMVEAARLSDMVIIRVSDNGPGLKTTPRDKLFEPFFTTKTQGSGLGLYLSKRIVEQHRGQIRVVDGKEGLTTFEVSLPIGDK